MDAFVDKINTLTAEERIEIQQQITAYKEQEVIVAKEKLNVIPVPDNSKSDAVLDAVIANEATPDKKEVHKLRNKIRGIWAKYRITTLDAKALEAEKIACKIEVERTKAQAELNAIRRSEEASEVNHWVSLNKGNLEEVGMNTTSKPSRFWYALRRGCHHITKLTSNVPKIIANLFLIGVLIIGLIVLKQFNVI